MTEHLSALTLAIFAAWAAGCLLLMLLMLFPRFRDTVRGLWLLMASELLIISVGVLPWHLPRLGQALLLVIAGSRIGFEAGRVYGLKDGKDRALLLSLFVGALTAAIWWLPVVPWWAWLLVLVLLGSTLAATSKTGLGRFMLYPALPFAAFAVCARENLSGILVLSFLLVELFDSFSLLGGKLFGRNLLAPRISPKKTWEGFGLGLAMLLLSAVIIGWLLKEPIGLFLTIAVLVAVSALAGDLVASAIKRRSGVKDYPTIIPVQGGLLDIIDAWIVAAPVAAGAYLLMVGTA